MRSFAKKWAITLCTGVLGLVIAGEIFAQRESYQVVVNSKNPASSMSRKDVKNLFLKRTTEWSTGIRATIVDLPEESTIREQFCEEVLGRSLEAMTGYWQKMVFSGRATPPKEFDSDAEVLAFVGTNVGAIGYVSSDAQIAGEVRVLTLTD